MTIQERMTRGQQRVAVAEGLYGTFYTPERGEAIAVFLNQGLGTYRTEEAPGSHIGSVQVAAFFHGERVGTVVAR